ncbi:unnamed protein product [Eretmochelys imbricata]
MDIIIQVTTGLTTGRCTRLGKAIPACVSLLTQNGFPWICKGLAWTDSVSSPFPIGTAERKKNKTSVPANKTLGQEKPYCTHEFKSILGILQALLNHLDPARTFKKERLKQASCHAIRVNT